MREFQIADRPIGPGKPCLVVGEVGQNHDGSLGLAHAFIDAIADAEADAVKFQTHIAAGESTPQEPFRVAFSRQDKTRYDYWARMEFTPEQWNGLAQHAGERGLLFLSSPFSMEAVDILTTAGVPAWKVASGEITNAPLIERMAATRLPLLLSTGMSSIEEIDQAVDRVQRLDVPFLLLQATTAYPCPPERVGLKLIPFLRSRYDCPVGLSDHSGTIYAGLAAAALGIEMLEVHVTLSKEMFGPDVPASVTTQELGTLVEGVRFIEKAMHSPFDKDSVAEELAPLHSLFSRSVVVNRSLPKGTELILDYLIAKKPGTGIPASAMDQLVGRRLARNVPADHILQQDDLEAEGAHLIHNGS